MGPETLATIDLQGLDALIAALRDRGYAVVGPRVREEAIVFDEVHGTGDLPAGWTDEQDGGTYRLHRRDDDALFGFAVGPHSWQQFLFPPRTLLLRARRTEGGFEAEPGDGEPPAYAFLGVRGCDLAAIGVQDRGFRGQFTDPT
jgi:sulfhydrogenase subunit beta (sulfur reductase)